MGGAELAQGRIWKGQASQVALGVTTDVVLTLPRSAAEITPSVEIDGPLIAPLKAGDVVGRVVLTRAGESVGEAPLEVLQAVEPAGFFARLWDTILLWFQQLLG